ncbi:MAG: hypothetical protein ACLFN8_03730 [Candidatus Woesearchaeota archaeon]
MKQELAKKITLIIILLTMLSITACAGFRSGNERCTEGDFCSYYTGSRGVITMLDNPPQFLNYRSSDIGDADSNFVEFNVRVRNDGPSDSYGAVFFTGVGSENFQIYNVDDKGTVPVLIPKTRQACAIDLFNIGDLSQLSTWNFMVNCFGVDYAQFGDRTNVNIGFGYLAEQFGEQLPWLQRLADRGVNLGFQLMDGEMTQLNLGADFGLIRFGRSLMIIISGLNFEAFGGMSFYLQGDNPDFPGGDFDFKTFRLQLVGHWPAGQDYYMLPYQIRSCYAYTTFVSPMICIDPDPFSEESKVCNDHTYTWSGSQGAPVAVTKLESYNTGKEVIITATIKNIGIGDVWDVGYLEYCSPYFPATIRPSMKNVVYIGHMQLENKMLDCSSSFKINLDPRTKEGRLTCRYDLAGTDYVGSARSAPLRMELWYGYEENIRGQITVRRFN